MVVENNPQELTREILRLKKETDTIILAHNYQISQVQDVADYVGDSLGLARLAASTNHSTILFCGVHFMAETAAIISPKKRVLIPDLNAGCSLSDSITVDDLCKWKTRHPNAVTVGYVNTTATIKAELDYCCTSSNAVSVVNAIPRTREILFLPDMFLGAYVAKKTGRNNIRIWAGECHVHAGITPEDVTSKLDSMPNAEFLVHPECSCTTPMLYDIASGEYGSQQTSILSTEGMMRRAAESKATNFVVATEVGMIYRLAKQNPQKNFVPATSKAECQYMKMINLQNVHDSLLYSKYVVKVPAKTAIKARRAIQRMLDIS